MMRLVVASVVATAALAAVPNARPPPGKRTFNSTAVEALIASYLPRFIDPDLGTIFANSLPNSLDTTVTRAGNNDSFIITGSLQPLVC